MRKIIIPLTVLLTLLISGENPVPEKDSIRSEISTISISKKKNLPELLKDYASVRFHPANSIQTIYVIEDFHGGFIQQRGFVQNNITDSVREVQAQIYSISEALIEEYEVSLIAIDGLPCIFDVNALQRRNPKSYRLIRELYSIPNLKDRKAYAKEKILGKIGLPAGSILAAVYQDLIHVRGLEDKEDMTNRYEISLRMKELDAILRSERFKHLKATALYHKKDELEEYRNIRDIAFKWLEDFISLSDKRSESQAKCMQNYLATLSKNNGIAIIGYNHTGRFVETNRNINTVVISPSTLLLGYSKEDFRRRFEAYFPEVIE